MYLIPLQRTLSRVSRRISGSAGTVRLWHRPIVRGRGFVKEKGKKIVKECVCCCCCRGVGVGARLCRIGPPFRDDESMMSNARWWFSVSTRNLSSWSVAMETEEEVVRDSLFVGPLGTRPISLSAS